MASSPGRQVFGREPEPEPGSMSDPIQKGDVYVGEAHAQDGQYHEVKSTTSVPTKHEDENEMQIDSDRPGSAGTTHSMAIPEEEEELLASLAATTTQETNPTASKPSKTLFLSRPETPTQADAHVMFSYGKANQQHMDFQGTRRVPQQTVTAGQPEHPRPENGSDHREQFSNLPVAGSMEVESPTITQPDAAAHDPRVERERPRTRVKKSKSKKALQTVSRHDSREQTSLPSVADGTNGTEAFDAGHHQPYQEEVATVRNTQDLPDVFVVDQQGYVESPRDQLHEDLEHAVQEQDEHQLMQDGNGQAFDHQPTDTYLDPSDTQPQAGHAPSTSKGSIASAAAPPTNVAGPSRLPKVSEASRVPRQPFARQESGNDGGMNSGINDCMQMLVHKIREQAQVYIDKAMAERDDFYHQLQRLVEVKEGLQQEFDRVTQDNAQLSSACGVHKAKLAKYQGNLGKLKTFVDGIGQDIDNLRQDANAARHRHDRMLDNNEAMRRERDALQQQMSACAEKSSALKDEALKAFADSQHQLQLVTQERDMLNRQLDVNVGLLSEERDRYTKLQRFLDAQSHPSGASQEILSELRRANNELQDKLHVMHATVECNAASSEISNMLKKTLEEVKKVESQASSGAESVASTRDLVVAVNERIAGLEQQPTIEPLQTQLETVRVQLKEISEHQGDRVRQEAAHRESINNLEEKLKGSGVRITSLEGEIKAAETRESELKAQNKRLEKTIANSHQQSLASGDAQAQLDEIRADLQLKAKALESANAGVIAKTTELEALSQMKDHLESTIGGLREKVEELQQAVDDLTPRKQAMDEQIRKEVERERAEAARHSRDFQAQLEMEKTNEIRKLASERDRFEKQVTPLKTELASCKKQIEALQREAAEGTATSEQWEELKELAESRAHEIEALRSSGLELQQSADRAALLEEEKSKLQADLDGKKICLEEATQEKQALLKEIEGCQLQSTEDGRAREQAQAELTTYRANVEAHMERSEKELKEAQEARRRAEAGQLHTQKTGEAALEEERAKSRRKVEDLQEHLANTQDEVEKAKAQGEEFRAEVDKQWQLNRAEQQRALDEMRDQVEASEVARDEVVAEKHQVTEELASSRREVESLKQQLASARDELEKASVNATEDPSSLEVPRSNDGITPSANIRFTAPTRPRKKVDRNHNSTIDATAVPAPDELRPESRRADASMAKDTTQEPVVQDHLEDAQLAGLADQGRNSFPMCSDVEESSQAGQAFSSQQPTERVEETQFDSLPSFAAFSQSLAGNAGLERSQVSQSRSMPYGNPHEPSFAIYEDQQDVDEEVENKAPAGASSQPPEPFVFSQEEIDKYTFRKPMPHPNSASKLVRNGSQQSNTSTRRTSGMQERAPLRERRLETPEGRGEAVRSSQSSSPAYLQPTSSRPPRTYSNGVSASIKRQPSKAQTTASQDPRLAGRSTAQAPKRKAETSVVEGYEQERKKRLNAGSSAPASQTPRFSLRSNSQQSVRDLPSVPSTSTGSRASNSQSHLWTYGGGNARLAGGKKSSKGDEINARFSQELRR